jgi:hypothetical protein
MHWSFSYLFTKNLFMRMRTYLSLLAVFIFTTFVKAQYVGIGTSAPAALLHVVDSSVVFSATGSVVQPGNDPPISGAGRRMMWYADKAAFRVGEVDVINWNKDHVGQWSFAGGYNTVALGQFSQAYGFNAVATGLSSVSLGFSTAALGSNTTAFGSNSQAEGESSIVAGTFVKAESFCETVIGYYDTHYTAAGLTSWNLNDRLFVIGNGTSEATRNDALVVLKNGKTGIGNATPSEALDVTGNIKLSGSIQNEAFQGPTLLNSWIDYGAPHAAAAYYKDKEGRVHLRGLIKNGTATPGTVLFNLPAGYRPSTSGQLIFAVISNNSMGRVDVKPNGDVVIILATAGFLSLDGISFRAD